MAVPREEVIGQDLEDLQDEQDYLVNPKILFILSQLDHRYRFSTMKSSIICRRCFTSSGSVTP